MVGIYKITNQINGKCYIGQSSDVYKRWTKHRNAALNSNYKQHEYPLYRAMRKYGIENFLFELLEECERNELNNREIFYIEKYNSCKNGYNQDAGGTHAAHYIKLSEYMVSQIIHRLKTSNANSEVIGAEFGVSGRMIRDINTGKSNYRDNETYPIRAPLTTSCCSASNTIVKNFCKKCGVPIVTNGASFCIPCSHDAQRKAERPEPLQLASMVKEIGFTQTGKRFDVDGNTIKKWCKAYNIPYKLNELISWYDNQIGIIEPAP